MLLLLTQDGLKLGGRNVLAPGLLVGQGFNGLLPFLLAMDLPYSFKVWFGKAAP
jgi:hypothetical protein